MSLREKFERCERAAGSVPSMFRSQIGPVIDVMREAVEVFEQQAREIEALRKLVGELGARVGGGDGAKS